WLESNSTHATVFGGKPSTVWSHPLKMWSATLLDYMQNTKVPRNLHLIGSLATNELPSHKERFDLPRGVLITTSKSYCMTTSPRTLPLDSIWRLSLYTHIGKLPAALIYDPPIDNVQQVGLTG